MNENVAGSLRDYQRHGVAFLVNSQSALLADEMGLGKTVQVCTALGTLANNNVVQRALIIVPASLQLNWVRELTKWAPDLVAKPVIGDEQDRLGYYSLPIRVLVATYEQIVRDIMALLNSGLSFDVVVLDEAQRIKNSSTTTSFACRSIRTSRSWALTGTPLENSPEDLVALFRFLKPGVLHVGMPRQEMHAQIKPHFLRRTKKEVLPELPPIIDQELQISLTEEQRLAYDRLWRNRTELIAAGDGHSTANMLALVTQLKQLCNYDSQSNHSSKLEALQSILDGLTGESAKALVFSQFVETLQWLSARIDVPHGLYSGNLDQAERDRILTRFRNDTGPRALLISLRAGGVGLNLQEASTVVLFDRWWNPAVEDQAVHRAHRLGRSRALHVIRFLVVDSIEERIANILNEKRDLFEEYIDAAESSPASEFLDAKDLERVLR